MKICKKIDDYEYLKEKKISANDLLLISFLNDGVYLNDVKIIDQKSKLQIEVFKILVEHYKNEIFDGIGYLPISKMCSVLKKVGIDSYNLESQIHISIYRIRKSVKKTCNFQNIIESSKWNGYRLGDQVFIKRNKKM